ncbi:MAG TPA: EAL domain-containing protein [Pseudomonas sp.]|nr:EAL domain-containing protein [Pseudomonas sp.]
MRFGLQLVHPQHRDSLRATLIGLAVGLLLSGLIGIAAFTRPLMLVEHYLSWHILLETAALVVAVLIFAVGWSTCSLHPQRNVLLLACAFLGVGLLDFSHMLSYRGMPDYVTPSDPEKAIHFWLAARYLAAGALLLVVWLPWPPIDAEAPEEPRPVRFVPLLGVLAGVALLHALFFFRPEWLPRTFVDGQGLTAVKVYAEYGVIAIHLFTVLLLLRRLGRPSGFNVALLLGSVAMMVLSELYFTRYIAVSDLINLLGHLYKVLAYLLLYRALFVEMITSPYRALNSARRHAQAILEAIPDRLVEFDRDGRYCQVHLPRNELPALDAAQLLGRTVHEVLPAEAAQTCMAALHEAQTYGHSRGRQIRIPLVDGDHWFELSASAMRAEDSGEVRFVMLSRDITTRTRDQDTLRKLSQAVEQSASTIVITDLEARIEYANQAFTRATGYSLEEAIGQNPRLLHSGKTPKSTYDDMWEHLTSGRVWRGEFVNKRKDGSEYTESVLISPVFDAAGRPTNYLAIKEDITQRKLDEQRIERLAHFDALTNLPNRKLFASRCEQALGLSERSHQPLAVLYMDLDHFKHINDSLGYRVGDAFLVEVAQRLKSALRGEDTLSRPGGDEFVLVLPYTDAKGAAHAAERLRALLASPCLVGEHSLVVSASIGIAMYPEDGRDFDSLAQRADIAMHRAKQDGRNSYCFFTAEMQRQSARTLELESALRQVLERGELHLCFQPQVSIDGQRLVGAEALLRWNHPQLGAISPAEFIPIAEGSGLILPIGEWVLRAAARQMKRWLEQGYPPDMTMAVNLSLVQFRHPGLVELVIDVLKESGLPAHCLELELTESVAMHDPAAAIAVVRRLHALGVRLSIDDFGTGYSSLSYLKQFEVHKLKIDQSFVRHINADGHDQSIVRAVIGMAASLGMLTIAEGVETAAQRVELERLGCDEVQGYLFGRPLPAAEFEALMRPRLAVPEHWS